MKISSTKDSHTLTQTYIGIHTFTYVHRNLYAPVYVWRGVWRRKTSRLPQGHTSIPGTDQDRQTRCHRDPPAGGAHTRERTAEMPNISTRNYTAKTVAQKTTSVAMAAWIETK